MAVKISGACNLGSGSWVPVWEIDCRWKYTQPVVHFETPGRELLHHGQLLNSFRFTRETGTRIKVKLNKRWTIFRHKISQNFAPENGETRFDLGLGFYSRSHVDDDGDRADKAFVTHVVRGSYFRSADRFDGGSYHIVSRFNTTTVLTRPHVVPFHLEFQDHRCRFSTALLRVPLIVGPSGYEHASLSMPTGRSWRQDEYCTKLSSDMTNKGTCSIDQVYRHKYAFFR